MAEIILKSPSAFPTYLFMLLRQSLAPLEQLRLELRIDNLTNDLQTGQDVRSAHVELV